MKTLLFLFKCVISIMSECATALCRLCADSKHYSKLINLQTDGKTQNITYKLNRLSLQITNWDSSEDAFPKTVCLPCIDSLNTAYNFVMKVAASQSELKLFMLSETIKEEVINEVYYDSCEEKYDETDVKEEYNITSEDSLTSKSKTTINNNIKDGINNSTEEISNILTWKDYSWLCAHCDTMFPCIEELKDHSMQYHGCCNPYRCTDCKIRKLSLARFIKHVKQHRKHLKLSCYSCYMTFSRDYDTRRHSKVHADSKYCCPGCNETFSGKKLLTEHCKAYNKEKRVRGVPLEHLTEDFSCVVCKKKFKDKGGLAQHLLIHTDRKRDYTCEICGKCFLNKSNLSEHMMMHSGSRPHQCEICKNSFRTPTQLRLHLGVHEGKKPFSCEQCGRQFRLKRQLIDHSIIHTDSLPHICSYCQKGFRFKTILNQHLRQHTGLKPYKCQICHREFTNWPNYNKHMKRKHDMNMAKRKHTPDGLLHVDPVTGKFNLEPEINKTLEFKKTILNNAKSPARPTIDCVIKITS